MSLVDDLSTVGSSPSVLVMNLLHEGSLRFTDLLESDTLHDERTLSDSLRELDRAGLVARRVEAGPPLRVLYGLTDSGARLSPTLEALTAWLQVSSGRESPKSARPANP
jgi:DNA-binding HxlR family transcriptional regulator